MTIVIIITTIITMIIIIRTINIMVIIIVAIQTRLITRAEVLGEKSRGQVKVKTNTLKVKKRMTMTIDEGNVAATDDDEG